MLVERVEFSFGPLLAFVLFVSFYLFCFACFVLPFFFLDNLTRLDLMMMMMMISSVGRFGFVIYVSAPLLVLVLSDELVVGLRILLVGCRKSLHQTCGSGWFPILIMSPRMRDDDDDDDKSHID